MADDPDKDFVKLLTEHQGVICSFVISLLPGAPGTDDVIQEVNTLLWAKRSQFELGTNFRAWALAVARFQVMAHLRVLKQRRWVTLDDDVAAMLAEEIEEHAEPEVMERQLDALRACLGKLRPEDRDLLLQRYWRKSRLQDFAVDRGRSLSGLKVQLFRLRAALKRCIEDRIGECLP
ncbi:sigma-70 family RNA polymerase sigma factor [Luteolibacter flavescens]|uniref:Sigma-70 family RNA polymerase sigma factor n=1 Tax=Luteolibacter flavescens TaxID=1859460 RepID=A0ABT3FT03_9BACT|nr:sigma-70 family RNA polymerase sigma factor [Luteolibacter flavescens]MCW1886339.1 sigma-70 family RNA polymerase sigma factor [Luteolibacter flavescens]